jgi:3-methyladenine DNA glycosylase AlkD
MPDKVQGMARYGMTAERRLGVSVPNMRSIAKETGKDHDLALRLWEIGIPEARIVAAMVDRPEELTERQMDEWVAGLNSWDVCDQVCMSLFRKSPLAWKKIIEWSEREEEYVKRAAYALIACLAWYDKEAGDQRFSGLFPVIKRGATDERNYVRKVVSWALRNIGKRNRKLNRAELEVAEDIGQMDTRAARCIASDVKKELSSEAVQKRLGA